MPKSVYFFGLILMAVSIIFAHRLPHGEIVEHHGLKVEADVSYIYCLSCHEGVLGKDAKCVSGSTHPIMNTYPPAGQEFHYAPIAVLKGRGVKFEGNRISCITCHNLRNAGRHHLVIENEGSRLCFACHYRK